MQDLMIKHLDLLACPECQGPLKLGGEVGRALVCSTCQRGFAEEDEIPLLFCPHDSKDFRDTAEMVKRFYEENPFPNYDDFDSSQSLMEKARRGVFARLLDEQIPRGANVLEAGCGTGQLSNFLGMHWGRQVFGTDVGLNSLRLANAFRRRCEIPNVAFLQMNLFKPAFKEQSLDVVISNGVLHHTPDPETGFASLARLLKPNGVIIIGLYNSIGRLTTNLRRFVFRVSRGRFQFLDGHLRNKNYNEARKRAWFKDQYEHPLESQHSYNEILGWFKRHHFDFLMSIPKCDSSQFSEDEQLFFPHDPGTRTSRLMTQLGMMARGGSDGALFIMIGRKKN